MFATILFPETLESEDLDNFLANGWYRMGQSIFTTHFLCFQSHFYSAVWLRVRLDDAADDAKFIKLQKQNQLFKTEIKKAALRPEQEALYKNYKQGISFEPTETLQTLLYGFATTNHFNTYEVNVYDGPSLIASGFFDIGKQAGAGIVSFYHPDYKKYSLGKYLIYLKMNFCKQQQLTYFYPGYVAPGYPPFDYKLTIGKTTLEFFAVSNRKWLPYSSFSSDADPLKLMHGKLVELQEKMIEKSIPSQLLYYRFFDANLDPYYSGDKLLDYPVFLYCLPQKNNIFKMIVFDVRNQHYCLVQCSSVIQTDWFKTTDNIFSSHLLRANELIYTSTLSEAVIAWLS